MPINKSFSKENTIEIRGRIIELLPNSNFKVHLENGYNVIAYTSGKMRKNRIKILIGDQVIVSMSIYDSQRGRIVHRN